MVIRCKDDYGTLEVGFAGFLCNLCDDASYMCIDVVEQYLMNYGQRYEFVYFEIDTDSHIVSVYANDGKNDFNPLLPVFTMSARKIFLQDSMLLKLYNMFVDKRHFIMLNKCNGEPAGQPKFLAGRHYH